jgi:predicted DNA-binding transcriptional regulator YafY
MKTERLLSIIILLLQRKRVTAKELAEQLEVSVRTIYRDIDSINLAGIPVVSHQGMDGGYEILSSFMLQNQALNVNDRKLLLSTLKGITSLFDDSKMEQVMESIGNSERRKSESDTLPIVIDFSPWGLPNQHTKLLTTIKKAIEHRREIDFLYIDGNGSETQRQIQPSTIIVKAGIPYVYGYCLHREATRLFRVSRMRDVVLTERRFKWQSHIHEEAKNLELSWIESTNQIALSLLFHPRVKVLVEESFTPEQITFLETGSLQVSCLFPEGDWVLRFLLSFGADVEILEPEDMKQKVKEEAEKIFRKYL